MAHHVDVPQQGTGAAQREAPAREEEVKEAAPTGHLAGDPQSLGLPAFIAGSASLGLVLINFVPATAVGSSLPIILAAASLGLIIATIWALSVGQTTVACIFGVFSGFWFSYALLLLGLTHNWFGIGVADLSGTQELFLTVWLIVIGMVTLGTLRLPMAYTAVLALVDVALALVLIGTIIASPNLLMAGGATALLFAAVGAFIFLGISQKALGGKSLPLGRPVLR